MDNEFYLVISIKYIEGIKVCTNSNNSENLLGFVKMFGGGLKMRWEVPTLVIIWDNASIHTLKESTEFMKSKGIKWITNTPYS